MSQAARQRALKLLERRMRSEEEVRRDLLGKGFSEEETEDALAYLYSYDYLNDGEYAAAYIRDKLRFSPQGPLKLRHSLLQRGVDEEVIDEALRQEMPPEMVESTARELARKHRDKGKNKTQTMRYLYSRGFAEGLVWSLGEEIFE